MLRIDAVFLLALLLAGNPQQPARKSGTLLDEGIRLLEQGKLLEAVNAFGGFKQRFPADSRPYFYSGIAMAEAGKLSAAALELQEAIRLDQQKSEYMIFHAHVLSRLGHADRAIEALAAFTNDAFVEKVETPWLWLLVQVNLRLERPEEASRIVEILGRRDPSDARVDLYRGKVSVARGDVEHGLQYLKKSIAKSGNNAEAFFDMGKISYQRNEMSAAKKALLQAVSLDGKNPEYLHLLGMVCLALDQAKEAIGYLKRAEPAAFRHPQVYYALGNAYQRDGDRVRAVEYRRKYQNIIVEQRLREDANREAGKLLARGEKQLDLGNNAEARTLFERAIETEPGNWDAHGYLAEMSIASGDWQQAYGHLVKMQELDPASAVGNYLMAQYWYHGKEMQKARACAEKVKLLQPGHGELRNLLGHIYLELGEQAKALEEYKAAASLEPQRADFQEDLRRAANQPPQ